MHPIVYAARRKMIEIVEKAKPVPRDVKEQAIKEHGTVISTLHPGESSFRSSALRMTKDGEDIDPQRLSTSLCFHDLRVPW